MTPQDPQPTPPDLRTPITRQQWDSIMWDAWRAIVDGRVTLTDLTAEQLGRAAFTLFRIEDSPRPDTPSLSSRPPCP